MKKIYNSLIIIVLSLFLIFTYDYSIYIFAYIDLLNHRETIAQLISYNGGITIEIKEICYKNNIYLDYKKSNDMNGAVYKYTIYKVVKYVLCIEKKYVKINEVIILGF